MFPFGDRSASTVLRLSLPAGESGFTLVELALVMIVIGLLFGAVLKANNLIEQGRVKQTVRKLDELHAATLTYLDRFNKLPGDTDGDGQIDDNDTFWQQLHDSGLIAGSGTAPLKTPWGTPYAAGYQWAGTRTNVVCVSLPVSVAEQIDTRYDDGSGLTGAYTAAADSSGVPASAATDFSAVTGKIWLCSKDIRPEILVGG